MEVYFNELSIEKNCLTNELIDDLTRVSDAIKKYNINTCRIDCVNMAIFQSYLINVYNAPNLLNWFFSFFKVPYEIENDTRPEVFLEHSWKYNGSDCYGLCLAIIYDSFSVSLNRNLWSKTPLIVQCDSDAVEVKNLADLATVNMYIEDLTNTLPLMLVESGILPEAKDIHLRHDHGMDILEEFSEKLIQSPYVVKIVNSLPNNPKDKRYIRKISDKGLIEIVLIHTDRGLGLVVQTTGRNYRETKKISEILEERYC